MAASIKVDRVQGGVPSLRGGTVVEGQSQGPQVNKPRCCHRSPVRPPRTVEDEGLGSRSRRLGPGWGRNPPSGEGFPTVVYRAFFHRGRVWAFTSSSPRGPPQRAHAVGAGEPHARGESREGRAGETPAPGPRPPASRAG